MNVIKIVSISKYFYFFQRKVFYLFQEINFSITSQKKNKIVFFRIEKFLFNKFILSLTPYGRAPSKITKGIRQSIIINFNISCVINIIPNTIAATSKIDKKIKLGRTENLSTEIYPLSDL